MGKFSSLIKVGLGFSIFAVSLMATADGTCFSSKQEYDKIKTKLPVSLQTLPVIFTVDSFAKAGFIIDAPKDNPSKMKLQMKVVSPVNTSIDEYIQSACLDKGQLTVTLDNKAKSIYTVAVSGQDLVIMNQTFLKSSQRQFDSLLSNKQSGGFGGFGVMGAQ